MEGVKINAKELLAGEITKMSLRPHINERIVMRRFDIVRRI